MRALILLFLTLFICSCKNESVQEDSEFILENDITDFSNKMENGDTLIILADLSICTSWHHEKNILYKKANKIYISTIADGEFVNENEKQLPEIEYNYIEKDTLNFENLFKYMKKRDSIATTRNHPIFTAIYKQNKIQYYTDGLINRMMAGHFYEKIKRRLYPKVKMYQPIEIPINPAEL